MDSDSAETSAGVTVIEELHVEPPTEAAAPAQSDSEEDHTHDSDNGVEDISEADIEEALRHLDAKDRKIIALMADLEEVGSALSSCLEGFVKIVHICALCRSVRDGRR